MGAAKKTTKKKTPNRGLKTNKSVLKVKLKLDENEKYRGEINGCEVAFWGHNENEHWSWAAITPHEWGACLGGIRFDSLQDAVRNAKECCVEPQPEGKKNGTPKKKKSMGKSKTPEQLRQMAELLGANGIPEPNKD